MLICATTLLNMLIGVLCEVINTVAIEQQTSAQMLDLFGIDHGSLHFSIVLVNKYRISLIGTG